MKIVILNEAKYSWFYEEFGDVKIYVKGLFWYDKDYFSGSNACKKILEIFNTNNLTHSLSHRTILKDNILKLRGHFSFIIDGQGFVLAFIDKIRSYPIFYCNKGNTFFISNSATKLQAEAGLNEKSKTSFLEFEMAGYVTGSNTLFKDLFQLQAGEFLLLDKKTPNLEVIHYYRYWTDEIIDRTEEELLDELHKVTVKTFSDMIETLDGRPVWIPLSGGLDSRLVLAMLHQLRYDNISTFSYGIPGLWEIKHAKAIAKHLKVKWHYIPFEPKKIKKLYHTDERRNYFDFASGLSSVPILPDYYALQILRNENIISDDAIIINGQSGDYLTGGHIPQIITEIDEDEINVDLFLKAIIDKHFSLWLNLKTEENISILSEKILYLLPLTPNSKLTADEFARYYELYEWQERQSKYVVNGQRMYDWLGYDWRLPLWGDELMAFWLNVNLKKIGQRLYKKYLTQYNFAGVFDIEPSERNSYMPSYVKAFSKILAGAGRVTAKDANLYTQKYLQYFMTYAALYPQKNYLEYLKDSQWHRIYVSYLVKDLIANI